MLISGKKVLFILGAVIFLLALTACRPSKADQQATITQLAANIYAGQTAGAPTSTQTSTPTPTSTSTPTPTLTSTITPSPTPTPTPTLEFLFFDDFSDPSSGWDEYSDTDGGMEYMDGVYRFELISPNVSFWSGIYRYYSNVIINVDSQKTKGPLSNEFGVICRWQDASNLYLLSISSDGYFGIFKMINEEWFVLGGNDWGFNDHVIHTGIQPNHIQARCIGNNLVLEVNGSVLMDVYDSELSGGDVGLFVGTYDAGGLEVEFDNFSVTKP